MIAIYILAVIGAITVLRVAIKSIRWWRENDGAPSMFTPRWRS